ncbi:MAG TPA: hypothetical protein VF171_04865 [Trueperaceae bacterium]
MGSNRRTTTSWDDKTRAAQEHLIEDVELTLGPEAGIADIERALHQHAPAFLADTFQVLADDPALSPEDETEA